MAQYFIYTLLSPQGEVRYVGYTSKSLKSRLAMHLVVTRYAKGRGCHRITWIQSLLNQQLKPIIQEIEIVHTFQDALQAEIKWIQWFKLQGCNLTNSTKGGDGVQGLKWTEAIYEKMTLKVCQYNIDGTLIKVHSSLSDASEAVSGVRTNNGKISGICNGKRGRRTFMGFVFRYLGDSFNKYPTTGQYNVTLAQRESLSKRQTLNNCMKNKTGKLHPNASAIVQYSMDLKFIQRFDTITDAYKKTGINNISLSCRKGIPRGGFLWKYE